MTFSRVYIRLWKTIIVLVMFPQLCRGLLSDFKICGDSMCESLISRVQTVRDHHGKDCRYLSFRQGETIFVYHKLTGKRSNLWAGSINKQFGYFPKEAVKEEQKFAVKEIVVPTQESDFLCVDDLGYPTDSNHLDSDDDVNDDGSDDDDDSDLSPLNDIEMSTTNNYETNSETPSKSQDIPMGSGTSKAELQNPQTAVELQENGGSSPSSWLSSPLEGWLGLEKPEDSDTEVKKKHLLQEEESFTSSVTGWLGLRSEGKPDNTNPRKPVRELESLASEMTGWLGIGGGQDAADSSAENVDGGVKEMDMDTAHGDNFRSRKMDLDLEAETIQKKIEDRDLATWFGNGLSRTLGFGPSDQDTGETIQVSREEEEEDHDNKETASNSWFDLGIRNILAFKKDSSEIDRNVLDTKSEDNAQGPVGSDNTASNSQDSDVDATSQPNQNLKPLETQKVVTDLVEDAKEGEKKFDPFASKNDITSLTFFTYMKPMSIGQSVCKIEDSPKHHLDSRDETEFTNELQNIDNFNISLVFNSSDEEQEALRRDQEILRLEDPVEKSQVQESSSENEKQEQVHDEVKGEDVDQQKYLDNTQNNTEEFSQKSLQATTQDELNGTEKRQNWKVSDINKHEENNPLDFDAHYLKRRDDKFTDENLSETDIENHSPHWNRPTQNGKGITHQDLPGTFTSVMNFLKEGSFGPSLTRKTEEKESKDEKHDVLGMEEEQKEIKLTEAQESSQVLVEKRKEAVKETENVQNYFSATENEEPVEKLQVETSEDLMDREQLDLKREKDLIMEAEKANDGALNDFNRQVNMKKEAVEDELHEEIEEKNIVNLGSSVEKGNGDAFKDDEEERFEKGEGGKHEVVNPFIEGEVVEESKEENIAESLGENGELIKELGDGEKREEGGKKFEKENQLDGESEEELKDKWQEKFNNGEQEEGKYTERYEVNSELVEKLEKYEVHGELVEQTENDTVQFKVKQYEEEEGQLEEKRYELSRELTEKRDELEDMGQNVEEQESTLDGELGEKMQDVLDDNSKMDSEFNRNVPEEVETLKEYEAGAEPVEELKQEDVKLLEKYEVMGQLVKMFEDYSQEDLEHKDQEKFNEVEENTIEEEINWKDVEETEEDGTHDEFVKEEEEEGKQELGWDLKVSGDMQKIGDFMDWPDVIEETKSFERMDELCTEMDPNEIQRGREGNSFEASSNLISDFTLPPSDILLGDATQHNAKKTPEIIVHDNGVNSGSENEFSVQIGESNESTAESGGFFGIFQKAINTFYQNPNMETKELPESPSEIDENVNEILKLPPVYPTEKEMDNKTNNTEFEAIMHPSTTPNLDSHSLPTNTAKPPQPNPLPKIDKTLQDHMDKEDTTILEELGSMPEDPSSQTHTMEDFLKWQVVSSLPDDMQPGADLYGIPWEPIIISSLIGLLTVLLFTCRFYRSVKSRIYRRKEWRMAEQVVQLLEEKCEVLETLGKCQQEYDELEDSLKDGDALAETNKTKDLEVKAQQLDLAKTLLEDTLLELKDQLDQQKAHRIEQEQKITLLEENMGKLEEETKELQSQEEQAQTTIKVYNMNCERLQKNMETSSEENALFKESNSQLRQQVEGWAERVCELEEEIRRYELAHSGMMQDVANKDERIMSLTDRLLGMKAWDADLEGGRSDTFKGTTGKEKNRKVHQANTEVHLQKVQKLIYAAKLNADLKSVDEDKDRVFAKLNDEVKAKEDLEVSIKELEKEQSSMQAETEYYSEQVQRLQQKLQIMTEMYQENELKLHRLLTVEEKDRVQKEDKLNKADKNIALAMEELNNYKHRAGEMEEELEKTKQSYQTQISSHEKKAHNNWLAARAADRQLSDIKRENSLLRQKITDTQFKLDTLEKDPFALDSLARPLPYRAERLPYGPSPLGRPASENRALLSSPTLLEGHLNRLSPRVTRGPVEHTGVQGERERSGGPHSDSGSISPLWEKDRRGPPPPQPPPPPGHPGPFPPQGYVFPEPGGPIYRRPGPPPGVMGPFPPPGPPFPHPRSLPMPGPLGHVQSTDTTGGHYLEHSLGPEHNHGEPGLTDGRIPPESVLRMGAPPPPGPSMGPLDGPFPRRAPFEPPDFFPPRGPGGPPMMPMWGPRPGMMMMPPRYPLSGPPPPHPLSYGPPMRPPLTDGLPPLSTSQQFVPHSQSLDEQKTLP
ncbi:cTAGE family member 5 [Stigmatopora nigra]